MPQYKFRGRDKHGSEISGELESMNRDGVLRTLQDQGVTPIAIEESRSQSKDVFEEIKKWLPEKKISAEEMIIFCRQMHALQRAGVPLIRSIHGLIQSVRSEALEKALKKISDDLESGTPLSISMEHQSNQFSPIMINMMRVGENTGNLDEVFVKVAQYLELERETKKRMKQATRYPTIVVVAISVAITVINLFVIPAFSGVFAKAKMELPMATKILMATSSFTVEYGWFILAGLILLVLATMHYVNTPEGRHTWDKYKLRAPLVGGIFERITLARFSRVFAMLTRSGVPILQALNVVSGAVGNAYIGHNILKMQSQIERGESLTQTAINSGLFTPLVIQMIAVGEESGTLDKMLDDVAAFYEDEVDYDLKTLADAIEPILLVAMGVMVLILALGVFLPMWDMSSMARR